MLNRLLSASRIPRFRLFSSSSTASDAAQTKPGPRFRSALLNRYVERLRERPGSYLTSFLVLHEVTAVGALPLVFYFLQNADVKWDTMFDQATLDDSSKRMSKAMKAIGVPWEVEDGSKVALNAAATYAIVKVAMPLRLALSFALTPAFARGVVIPITDVFGKALGRSRVGQGISAPCATTEQGGKAVGGATDLGKGPLKP
ncbi:hypothetical protein M427DRAFT_29761 [Gonapodya prolifera JEL478]|uniref:Uncharacterized protein n=1 Tax=Gonapodya prolifera (strain JEL478) TaxID=1344416 RepID=A0A139ANY4_GONPJ|nr:hypothetical protein M427DRAFT_29761 [Gonapodya prolifera JEL478]|eukprot:KXS18446.1 hypothetical protein M427DRAFT_29761 [Gonapodya prolifera JEL478]